MVYSYFFPQDLCLWLEKKSVYMHIHVYTYSFYIYKNTYPLRKTRDCQHHSNIFWIISVKPKVAFQGAFRFYNQCIIQQPHIIEKSKHSGSSKSQLMATSHLQMALGVTTQADSSTPDILWPPPSPMLEEGCSIALQIQHSKRRNGEIGRQSLSFSLGWSFQTHSLKTILSGDSTQAVDFRRHSPHSAELMIFSSGEIQKLEAQTALLRSCGKQGEVEKALTVWALEGKKAPKVDLKHRHSMQHLYEQAARKKKRHKSMEHLN